MLPESEKGGFVYGKTWDLRPPKTGLKCKAQPFTTKIQLKSFYPINLAPEASIHQSISSIIKHFVQLITKNHPSVD